MMDIKTALVFMVAGSAVHGVAALLLWRTQKGLPGLDLIAAGNLVVSLSLATIGSPNPHIVTFSNVMSLVSQCLILDGVARFFGRPFRPLFVVWLTLFSAVIWEVVQAWDPTQIKLRVVFAAAITLYLYSRTLRQIFRTGLPRRVPEMLIVFCLGFHLLVVLVRCAVALYFPDQRFVLTPQMMAWFSLEITMIQTLLFHGIMIIVGTRLNEHLQAQQATLQAERHMKMELRQFLHMLGHELRTPLAVINSATEMIGFSLRDPPANVAQRLGVIHGAVARVVALIDNLLTAERAGLDASPPETIDLGVLIAEAVDLLAEKHDSGRLRIECGDGGLWAQGDREMLFTAVLNLIDNALKYSPADEDVDVSLTRRQGLVCLRVRDRGIGFPPDQLHRVGERFFRAANAKSQAGTGLGLHIVKTIAARHGGGLDLQNAADGGAMVELRLPAA